MAGKWAVRVLAALLAAIGFAFANDGVWVTAGLLFLLAVGLLMATDGKRPAVDKLFTAAQALIDRHAAELSIRRSQLVTMGPYGLADDKRWQQEVDMFIGRVLEAQIGPIDVFKPVRRRIREAIEAAATSTAPVTAFRADLNPIEYEQLVADTLRAHGWDAQTTRATGDQGVDVLAIKGALRVVLQCKLYSRAIGNEAVQQAIAGQRFELATHAAVVSNATFTRSARELASAAGVLLLHHDELPSLGERLAPAVAIGATGLCAPLDGRHAGLG